MTKEEFKKRWRAGKISWDDIILSAKEWEIYADDLGDVRFYVLKAANVEDADHYDFRGGYEV